MKKLILLSILLVVSACANRPMKYELGDIVCTRHIEDCGAVTAIDPFHRSYKVAFSANKELRVKELSLTEPASSVMYRRN